MTIRRWPSLLFLLPLLYLVTPRGSAETATARELPPPSTAYTLKILKILRDVQRSRRKIPEIVISSPLTKGDKAFLPKNQSGVQRRKITVYRMDPPPATDSFVPDVTGPIICEVNDPPFPRNAGIGNYRRISAPLYTVTINQKTIDIDDPETERPNVAKQLSLFQGQGPEELFNFRAFASGKLVSFQGKSKNGNKILGQVDPAAGYLTTNWAEWGRLRDGTMVMSEFRFSKFKEIQHGIWFPTKITSYIQSGQSDRQADQYKDYSVDSFVFQPPPPSIFSVRLADAETTVNDNRFGPTIAYPATEIKRMDRPEKPVTPELLASLTQNRINTFSRFLAPKILGSEHPKGADARLIVLIAALFTGVVVALLSRIGSRKTKSTDTAFAKPVE